MPSNLPIFPDNVLIISCGASIATLMMLIPLFGYGIPIRPTMYALDSCKSWFKHSTESGFSTMIPMSATRVSIQFLSFICKVQISKGVLFMKLKKLCPERHSLKRPQTKKEYCFTGFYAPERYCEAIIFFAEKCASCQESFLTHRKGEILSYELKNSHAVQHGTPMLDLMPYLSLQLCFSVRNYVCILAYSF